MLSIVKQGGDVSFPAFMGERVYMHEFTKRDGLPESLSRWQPTVDAMLNGVDTDGPIYLMVDQKVVKAGVTHRRPGMHIDGYWIPAQQCHGVGGGRHSTEELEEELRRRREGSHYTPRHCTSGNWPNESIILASNVAACKGLVGEYSGVIGEGGDCSHLDLSGLTELLMQPNKVYVGNVTFLHESLPVLADCERTVVRLNVPGHIIH